MLLVALWLDARPAQGDLATEAQFRFKHGVELYQQGRLNEALKEFFVSNRLSRNPSTLFNIARCLELTNRFDEAFTYYSEYIQVRTRPTEGEDGTAALEQHLLVDPTQAGSPDDLTEGRAGLARVLPHVARLNVTSTPPGARIFVDRINLGEFGRTPRTFATAPGRHRILLEAKGYRPGVWPVILVQGQETILSAELERIVGRVKVTTEPVGAELRIGPEDGPLLGTTPCELVLPPGEHLVHFVHAGCLPEDRSILVVADHLGSLTVALRPRPIPTGRALLNCNISGALVTVDREEVGYTPIVLDDLPVGDHELAVRLPTFRDWQGALHIEAERPIWVAVQLEPQLQRTGQGPMPWIMLAGSAATLAASGVLGGFAIQKQDESHNNYSVAANVTLGGGLLMSGLTTALFLLLEPASARDSSARFSYSADR